MQSGQIDDFTRAALDFFIYPATDARCPLNDAAWVILRTRVGPQALRRP